MCDAPPPSEPHHIRGVGHFGGMGLKAPDVLTIPLCRKCHRSIHNFPGLWPDQWEMIVRTLLDAFECGVIGVKNVEKR